MWLSRERVARFLDRSHAFELILQARARARVPVLSVLCYHSVGNPDGSYLFDPEVIDVTPAQFREHLRCLSRHFTVIGVDTLCDGINGAKLPPNPVIISFDDGYRSCVDTALPILQEFGFKATFFVATHYVNDRQLYWWDTIHYLIRRSSRERIALTYPRALELSLADRGAAARKLLSVVKGEHGLDLERFLAELVQVTEVAWSREIEARLTDELIMRWDDIRKLHAAGMDIQSHTRSHRVLQTLSSKHLVEELVGARYDIEHELGHPVRTVAYPVGYSIRHLPEIRRAVQAAGYEVGFTNASGVNYLWRSVDPLDIRRIAMDRALSMPMFRGQLAVPPLGYADDDRSHSAMG
jgi:peptidoglycan/xylan/chitin deacetylase (PgdA/CDA1 family)